MITVKAVAPVGAVVLWERDPAHPDGEVFLVAGAEALVGLTPGVQARLRDGRLVEAVSEPVPVPVAPADTSAASIPPPAPKPVKPERKPR